VEVASVALDQQEPIQRDWSAWHSEAHRQGAEGTARVQQRTYTMLRKI
jgi:hypothetical protein